MKVGICTRSGRFVNPFDPDPTKLAIEDIASSLSKLSRFLGHTSEPYSVAQHSCIVSDMLPGRDLKLWGLLHDAPEAYLGDMPKPLKGQFAEFEFAEQELLKAVAKAFGLSGCCGLVPEEVHEVDRRTLATEARDVLGWDIDIPGDPEPYKMTITAWPYYLAESAFLERFYRLTRREWT